MRLAVTGTLNSALFESLLGCCEPCIIGEDKKLELDFSTAEFVNPSGLVPFTGLLLALKRCGVKVSVSEYPASPEVCNYYCRMDFFKMIGAKTVCSQGERKDGTGRFIEISKLEHPEIAEGLAKGLIRLLQRLPKGVEATEESRSSFLDAAGELVSNTRHAYNVEFDQEVGKRPKALLQAQFYPKSEVVEFCVCDFGIGIKRSMEGMGGRHRSHHDAIDAALALRNKGEASDGRGLGLAALQSFIRRNGGILRVRTGDALKVQRGQCFAVTEKLPNWDGTIVSMEINVKKSSDLSVISKRLAK